MKLRGQHIVLGLILATTTIVTVSQLYGFNYHRSPFSSLPGRQKQLSASENRHPSSVVSLNDVMDSDDVILDVRLPPGENGIKTEAEMKDSLDGESAGDTAYVHSQQDRKFVLPVRENGTDSFGKGGLNVSVETVSGSKDSASDVRYRDDHGDAGDREVSSAQKEKMSTQYQTSDKWPQLTHDYFPGPIPPSPLKPDFTIQWDFDTSAFLQRPDVKGQKPKLITWMVPTRYTPPLPEPVRLRVCPEMPCRMTTDGHYRSESAALVWAGQRMIAPAPPVRSHPDQVFLFHNHESQQPNWIRSPSFRRPAWKSAFNWTVTYRFDSDIVDLYGKIVPRKVPVAKNYLDIWARKTGKVAMLVSNCVTYGRREAYVKQLRQYIQVDMYGGCSKLKCPRSTDEACFKKISTEYKFYLSFENAFCTDYISEKFFRYMGTDIVVVARGSNEYKNHAPAGTFINTADFQTPKALAEHLLHLDAHPEDYLKILKAKDAYQALYEDWPIRNAKGQVMYMTYHYSAITWCEVCRRLWNVHNYTSVVRDISSWVDRGNCYPPPDL